MPENIQEALGKVFDKAESSWLCFLVTAHLAFG